MQQSLNSPVKCQEPFQIYKDQGTGRPPTEQIHTPAKGFWKCLCWPCTASSFPNTNHK